MTGRENTLYHPRAWVYARGTAGSPVLQEQIEELCEAALRAGCVLVGQSSDGRRFSLRRPGRAALLRAVRKGRVDDVFVTRLSQLSRKTGRLRRILRLLHRKRVRLHTTESDLRYDLYLHGLDPMLTR